MTESVLVTGGAGFIGSHFVRHLLRENQNVSVVNVDGLKYAANLANLRDIETDERYTFKHVDLSARDQVRSLFSSRVDTVVHFAAESHVDRSIDDAEPFMHSNVLGTYHLLEEARKHGVTKFVQVSTDEVYGSRPDGKSLETDPLHPSNPYAASKASADLLCLSYAQTYAFPVVVTRCTNNYGPNQFPEKFIPHMMIRALQHEPLPIYGDGLHERDWLHVTDHCHAIDAVRKHGQNGDVYHIGAETPLTNLKVAEYILDAMGQSKEAIQFVSDRPGHDTRYCLDATKIREELSWSPRVSFEEGIKQTITWYQQNKAWWSPLLKKADFS